MLKIISQINNLNKTKQSYFSYICNREFSDLVAQHHCKKYSLYISHFHSLTKGCNFTVLFQKQHHILFKSFFFKNNLCEIFVKGYNFFNLRKLFSKLDLRWQLVVLRIVKHEDITIVVVFKVLFRESLMYNPYERYSIHIIIEF